MKGFEPDYQTALAVEFIKQNRQSPFFLYLSWGPPHTPRTPPDSVKGLYHPRQFALRENVPLEYEEKARVEYAGYYGLCTALDRCLGILLKAIDAEGLAENTIVVFTADHGDMLGSQALEYKNQPYEESARVPLLVRYPKALPAEPVAICCSRMWTSCQPCSDCAEPKFRTASREEIWPLSGAEKKEHGRSPYWPKEKWKVRRSGA